MRFRLVVLICAVFALTVTVSAFAPQAAVQAESAFVQDMPRLDGMNIYFTESAKEASRFDRLGTGISRFAGLLDFWGRICTRWNGVRVFQPMRI